MSFAYHYSILDSDQKPAYKQIKGVLSIEGEELLFEYKLYDQTGTVISTLNKFSIDVQYLKDITFKKGWIKGGKLTIETSKMVFLEPLPGSALGKIALNVKREDRKNAHDFVQKLNIALSERRLDELD